MKQILRLWGVYGLKRTHHIQHIHPQSIPDKWNANTRNSGTRSSFPRTFFALCSNFSRAVCVLDVCRMREILAYSTRTACERHARWTNKVRRKSGDGVSAFRKALRVPCSSPPSLIPHPCPIPVISLYTSVKTPKDGTLPKGARETYGRNAHSGRQRIAQGSYRGRAGDRLESASEISLPSVLTCTARRLPGPVRVQSERNTNPVEDQTKHPSRSEGYPVRRWSVARPLGTERNIEESYTHAKAPARYGLGLALGLVMFFLLAMGTGVHAQTSARHGTLTDSIRPLQIGDSIPEALWHLPLQVVNHPQGKEATTLNDYRGKLIILDFWATWCSSCIEGFPKLERLHKRYADEISVLLVNSEQTGDDTVQVNRALTRYRLRHGYVPKLPYLLGDTLFQRLFPHKLLPHIVWIGPSGRYLASSYSDALTLANIESALDGDVSRVHIKSDVWNEWVTDQPKGVNIRYYSVLSGYREGYGFDAGSWAEHDDYTSYRITNYPLSYLYQVAFPAILRGIPENQWFFSESVDTCFRRWLKAPERYKDEYCYEVRVPHPLSEKEVGTMLSQTLWQTFLVSVKRATRDVEVLVFDSNEISKRFVSAGGIPELQLDPTNGPLQFKNVSLEFFLSHVGRILEVPVVSNVKESIPVDVTLPGCRRAITEEKLLALLEEMGIQTRKQMQPMEIAYFYKTD